MLIEFWFRSSLWVSSRHFVNLPSFWTIVVFIGVLFFIMMKRCTFVAKIKPFYHVYHGWCCGVNCSNQISGFWAVNWNLFWSSSFFICVDFLLYLFKTSELRDNLVLSLYFSIYSAFVPRLLIIRFSFQIQGRCCSKFKLSAYCAFIAVCTTSIKLHILNYQINNVDGSNIGIQLIHASVTIFFVTVTVFFCEKMVTWK